MTLNDHERYNGHHFALFYGIFGSLGANYVKVVKVRPILSPTKMYNQRIYSSFRQYRPMSWRYPRR